MKYWTGKGDRGTTTLYTSGREERVDKNAPIIEALGALDEVNTYLGLCKVLAAKELDERKQSQQVTMGHSVSGFVHSLQDSLFTIQAEIAGAPKGIKIETLEQLHSEISYYTNLIPQITTFIVAGGTELSAHFDIARTIARRAERAIVAVQNSYTIEENSLAFLNRLSSACFILARYANCCLEGKEDAPDYRDEK